MGAKKRVFLGNQEDGVIRIRHQIVDLRQKKHLCPPRYFGEGQNWGPFVPLISAFDSRASALPPSLPLLFLKCRWVEEGSGDDRRKGASEGGPPHSTVYFIRTRAVLPYQIPYYCSRSKDWKKVLIVREGGTSRKICSHRLPQTCLEFFS